MSACAAESEQGLVDVNSTRMQSTMNIQLVIGSFGNVGRVEFEVVAVDLGDPSCGSASGDLDIVVGSSPPRWSAVPDLPPCEYTINLTAFDSSDDPYCTGSTTVTLELDTPTYVNIALACSIPVSTMIGTLDIDSMYEFIDGNVCLGLHAIRALPGTINNTTGLADVQINATDPDGDPIPLSLEVTAGTLGDSNPILVGHLAETSYSCDGAIGAQLITVTASDGDDACIDTGVVEIVCSDL